ncbi:MAG: S8 family serine peptidase [Candidatus Kapabacteria bacterium]|nr:S8 family serine peptidase [Ignavibacteriota bacterium]MCW5883567.1 S8 family serine peptidase [Candidatus Kapabacteria bacterium]
MKKTIQLSIIMVILTIILACENSSDHSLINDPGETKDYIVTISNNSEILQSANQSESILEEIFEFHSIEPTSVFFVYNTVILGFAAELNNEQLNSLLNDKRISNIEEDLEFLINVVNNLEENDSDEMQTQNIPWGINAVGSFVNSGSSTGVAWVVDTGIDLTHPDLNVSTDLSRTFVRSGADALSPNDGNSHGSHVAGTIAALNNNFGVVGVCAGAELVAIKVFNSRGSGTASQIIAGLDYIGKNLKSDRINVVNMSLGGSASTTLDNAVVSLASKGAYIVIAAGNSSMSATNFSPARVNAENVFTISAYDSKGKFATFSNYGNPPIDFAAPGVSIYSTSKSGKYSTKSGTSMAAPHVAGILLANNGAINWSGYVTSDKDNNPDKKAVR